MSERHELDGESALLLEPGVGYVRAWAGAQQAAKSLRDALAGLGLAEDVPGLRAEVTAWSVGVVELGRVSPEAAQALADALAEVADRRREAEGSAA